MIHVGMERYLMLHVNTPRRHMILKHRYAETHTDDMGHTVYEQCWGGFMEYITVGYTCELTYYKCICHVTVFVTFDYFIFMAEKSEKHRSGVSKNTINIVFINLSNINILSIKYYHINV